MNTEPSEVGVSGSRHNGDRSPDEIEADIDYTRARMDADLAALEDRLSPGHLLDEAMRQIHSGAASEYFHNLGETAKHNPVPIALVSTGLAWLAISSRSPGGAGAGAGAEYGYEGAWQGAAMSGEGAVEGMKAKAGESWERAAGGATAAVQTAKDKAQQMRTRAREGMHSARAQARQGARRVTDFMYEQPLIAAGVALTVGAVLGAVLPSTRREDELMGRRSDELKGTLKRETEAALQEVEEGLQSTARSAEPGARPQSSSAQPSSTSSVRGIPEPQPAYSPPPGDAAATAVPGSLLPEEDLAIGEERGARVTSSSGEPKGDSGRGKGGGSNVGPGGTGKTKR